MLLERVTAAAEERHLSQNTLTAYRRTWIKAIAWAAAEGLALETLPSEKAGEFYEEATRGRSASHHLQVKAALALLYDVLGSTNPFAECPAPKFAPEKTELRYHTSSQLGQLVRELREDRRSYFGHLTYHLALALSDNCFLERATDFHLTLDVGVCLRAYCILGMPEAPSLATSVRITPLFWRDIRKSGNHLLGANQKTRTQHERKE